MHAFSFLSFGGGQDLPVNFYTTECNGNESKLINCRYEIYPIFYCSHMFDVGIKCKELLCTFTVFIKTHDRQVCIIQEPRKCHFHVSVTQYFLNGTKPFLLWKVPQDRTHSIPNFRWIRIAITEIRAYKAHLIFFVFFFLIFFSHTLEKLQ